MTARYVPYEASRSVPNVVVDGAPNDATVLTLTHWPGVPQPPGCADDLSAGMAMRFLRTGRPVPAGAVTSNHLDQDGLVAVFALVDPTTALRHEDLLVDVAAAGDFATYRHRDAARISMAIAAYADPTRSPLAAELTGPYDTQCEVLFEHLLDRLPEMVVHPERFVELWEPEDRRLDASERSLRTGAVTIEERADLDLAIVDVDPDEPVRPGHRFASDQYTGVHPMAIHGATGCLRILEVQGATFTFTDRYESWVQYRSRRPRPRVDLRPLADLLNETDPAGSWVASAPSALTPQLRTSGQSQLGRAAVLDELSMHVLHAPPAWDPYRTVPAVPSALSE